MSLAFVEKAPPPSAPATLEGIAWPEWVPQDVQLYLAHVSQGIPLRVLARDRGCHASTVLRQVRKCESRRDDPLFDAALGWCDRFLTSPAGTSHPSVSQRQKDADMIHSPPDLPAHARSEAALLAASRPVLTILQQSDTRLVVAPDLPKAIVLRDTVNGAGEKLAVLDRQQAEALALRGWIRLQRSGRVSTYTLAPQGEAVLMAKRGDISQEADPDDMRRQRYGQPETPIAMLARRRDRQGTAFLEPALVRVAAHLHEDFALASLGANAPRDPDALCDMLLDAPVAGRRQRAARERLHAVLQHLGPGLSDILLRCCCHQDGIEAAERDLDWSARSGKIVLRIALQRAAQVLANQGNAHCMIG